MVQYVNRIIQIDTDCVEPVELMKHVEIVLNDQGKEGWELVAVAHTPEENTYYLKKRLELV